MVTSPLRQLTAMVLACLMLTSISHAAQDGDSARPGPQDIVLVLDNSGSMRLNDKDFQTRKTAIKFVQDTTPGTHISVIVFDDHMRYAVHLGPASGPGRDAIFSALEHMEYQGHRTNIPEAIGEAVAELKTHGREQASKSVILLTDGVVDTGNKTRDRESRQTLLQKLLPDASKRRIRFYTVALGQKSDTELLQTLARSSQGGYYWAPGGADIPVLFDHIRTTMSQTSAPPLLATPTLTPADAGSASTLPATAQNSGMQIAGQTQPAAPTQSSGFVNTQAPDGHGARKLDGPVAATTPESSPDRNVKKRRRALRNYEAEGRRSGTAIARPALQDSRHAWWFDAIGVLIGVMMAGLLYLMIRARKSKNASNIDGSSMVGSFKRAVQPAPQAVLYDLTGVTGCQRHEIDSTTTLIGRVPPAPHEQIGCIILDRHTIGRRHAVIERKHYGFWLIDQHSKNGTYLNDQRISGEVCLSHGDRIRFHEYDFEFNLAGMGLADDTVPLSDFVAQNLRRAGGM